MAATNLKQRPEISRVWAGGWSKRGKVWPGMPLFSYFHAAVCPCLPHLSHLQLFAPLSAPLIIGLPAAASYVPGRLSARL